MGWIRKTRRNASRQRQLDVETLEFRQLLSASLGQLHPHPHSHPLIARQAAAVAPLHSRPHPAGADSGGAATSANNLIGAAQVQSQYGVNGTGSTVAVIDTGVDYNDAALGGGFGAGHKVVAGYDFVNGDGDPLSTDSHGTAVASLIASNSSSDPGVAPGADLAALRVFNDSNQGSFSNVVEALQWVVNNHSKYNITAVNLSMSDGNTYAQNWFAQDGGVGQQVTELIGQLDALNIPVIAATGNSFNGQQGVGFPAIVPDTISVTSTDAAGDQLSSNAQRLGSATGGASATDIAAPGEGLLADSPGNQPATVDGTSFATAEVTGAVVLLQQIYEQRFGTLPTVEQIDGWLQQGSDPVSDPVTDLAIGRLDLPKAAALIPTTGAQILVPPPSTSSGGQDSGSDSSGSTNPAQGSGSTSQSSSSTGSQQSQSQSSGSSGSTSTTSSSTSSSSSSTSTTSTSSTSTTGATTPTGTAGQGTGSSTPAQVYVNGESLDTIDQQSLSSTLGSMYSLLSGAFKSLSGWTNSDGSGSGGKIQIWTNSGKS